MKRPRSPRYDEAAPSSPFPPPAREDGFQYDVFLSFRGPDTGKGFTSHLYQALQDKGIHTFIDSEKLEKGQKVEELFSYIERSKIFVPIFSQGYANSEWCLIEITKMVECKRLIIPVFFDVEPTDVRHQSGPFAPAFTRYGENDITNKEKVRKWRNALIEAGKVSGYVLAGTNGDEATAIKNIVTRILTEVNRAPLFIGATHPIGLDSRLAELVEVLDVEAHNDVKMVGIHGMGGIGKTTLAKAVYNQLFPRFDACSFISNVREAAKQSSGLVSLQEQLLRDVLKDEKVKVNDIAHGTGMIMRQMQHKKVLLVLDDVDSKSQLEALVGSVDRFRPGSRIIITTRDRQVLIGPPTLRVKNVYEIKVLDSAQSLQLFSWHAFGTKEPPAEFAKLSQEVAATAAGLPLALEIFGSHFFCLETNKEREDMLKELKKNPDEGIHERLKISFDALNKEEKIVFLDIACFFIGEQSSYATFMWEECKLFPDLTIQVLMHKCLVNINKDTGRFEMHDLIRDMGRKIVEDENPSDPGMRSRLWKKDDILDVLQNNKGTEKIEAIDMYCLPTDSVHVDAEAFAGMSQLRMLRLRKVTLGGEYEHFPRSLKWLEWESWYLDSLPSTLALHNIVILDLSGSSITQVWKSDGFREAKVFGQLKVLNLSECWNVSVCPDFTCMPYIEYLDFGGCEKLTELHPSIVHLNNLTHLDLGWTAIKELPWSFKSLEKLDCLSVTGCKWLKFLPPLPPSLTRLDAECCYELEMIADVSNAEKLQEMNLSGCKNLVDVLGIEQLRYLKTLNLEGCRSLSYSLKARVEEIEKVKGLSLNMENFEEEKQLCLQAEAFVDMPNLKLRRLNSVKISGDYQHFPKDLRWLEWKDSSFPNELDLQNVVILDLSNSMIKELSLDKVHDRLVVLNLSGCNRLSATPEFSHLPMLKKLVLDGCGILTQVHDSIGFSKNLLHLSLKQCSMLKHLPHSLAELQSLETLNLSGCSRLSYLPDSIGDIETLKELELDFTNITTLPSSIESLVSLRLLSLKGCKYLTALPESIGRLKSLRNLVLDFTRLSVVPDSIGSLAELRLFSLEGCMNLMALPDSIGGLISLTDLVLDFTRIKEIPHSVSSLKNLQRVSLIGCLKELHDSFRETDWFASEPEITTFSSSLQEFSEKGVSQPEMTSFSSSLQELLEQPQVSKLGSSSSHLPKQFKYDVYLSFKREDAGNAFAINLSRALEHHGVAAFLDNGTLSKKDKRSDLLDAIENSNVAIPILTNSYFVSRWSLREIANVVKCCRMILPVFINHDPLHIKEQTGPLTTVFQYHKENTRTEEVDHWRKALLEVGDASGYHLQHDADGDKVRLVQLVVKRVLSLLNRTQCHPLPYTIGIKTRIDDCMKLLDIESGDVRMVGIVGVSGIGKTTLAKALFSRISNCYEASCFVSNGRTKATEQPNALVSLQNELIRGIFKDKVKPVKDVDEGMDVIRSKIQSERLLFVLDDADQTNLISAWVGERYSFHPGSRIIIVCRDVEVLRKNKVYEREIYQLQKLSEDESVELFNFYAFGRDKPYEQYQEMSKRTASSVGGLPLNLKVFGSFFSDCRNISKWEEVLEKLTSHGTAQEDSNQSTNVGQNVRQVAEQDFGSSSSPSRDIESRQNLETPMRPSTAPDSSSNRDANTGRTLDPTGGPTSNGDYDSHPNSDDPDWLEKIIENLDATAREIFLDIACFFIGMNRENAMHIWRGCEFSGGTTPEGAIQELLRVELVSINTENDTFNMDEKTKEIGRKMVEREDEELGKRSRLWEQEKSMHVLNNKRATDKIQGIDLNLESTPLKTTALSPMSKLRLMSLADANYLYGFKGLAVEPRWLKWQSTDASSRFPDDFNLNKVAVLHISKSRFNDVEGQNRFLKSKAMKWMKSLICGSSAKENYKKLKVLELNSSENQTAFPDLSNFPCLVKLTLDGCCRLAEVRTSIERQRELTCLKIRNCSILQSLPANFSSLVSLKMLDLSGCSSLSVLPDEVGNLQSLMELLLSGTAVRVIPESISQLRKLERLLLDNCEALTQLPGSLEGLESLQELSAKSCTSLATLPISIGNVSNLTHLLLDGTMIEVLPDTVGELKNLSHLLLDGTMIKELPNAVGELENLSQCSVCRCENLRRLPASMRRLRYLKHLDLSATGIRELPDDFGALSSLTELQMSSCKEIKELPESFANLRTLSSLNLRSNTNLTSLPSLRGLSQLKELNVVNCENLKMIPQLPSSLTKLLCYDCTALERLEDVSNLENLIELNLSCCTRLVEINGIDSLAALRRFHMSGCKRLSNASRNQLVQEIFEHLECFSIPGGEIPRVFTNRQLSYEVPVSLDVQKGMELLICLVVAVEEQAACWEQKIKVETGAEVQEIVKLPGVALSGKDDNLCLWHYKEADRVFPRGNVKITLVHHEFINDEVRNGGLCEPNSEGEAANEDGQQVSVFECISRCCRTSNSA